MRRFAFYFLVFLASFAIGGGAAVFYPADANLPAKTNTEITGVENLTQNSDENAAAELPAAIRKEPEEPFTFKKQIRRWLKGEELDEDWHNYFVYHPDEEEYPFPAQGRLEQRDLNGDGKKELIAFQECNPIGGNCSIDIFRSKQGKAINVLSTGQTKTVKVHDESSRRYNDLELRTWNTGFEYYVRIFKFNGKKYRENKCWFETNMIKGKMRDKPVITPIGCGKYGFVE
jgi:hypothetical protein